MQFSPSVFWELGAPSIVPVSSKEALSLQTDPNLVPTQLHWVGGLPPPVNCLIDKAKTQSHLLWTFGAFLLSSFPLFIFLLYSLFILKSKQKQSLSLLSIDALMWMRAIARELTIVGQETGQEEERTTKPAANDINPDEKELRIIFSKLLKAELVHVWKRYILKWAEKVDFIF